MSAQLGPLPRAVLWTLLLGALLLATDRLVLGPRPPRGWVAIARLEALPAEAGQPVVPPYLPETLVWPPGQIFYRTWPTPGWWLGLAERTGDPPQLWLGTGEAPPPAPLAPLAACWREGRSGRCPAGWRALSTASARGLTLHLVGRLEPVELTRILEGLRTAPGPAGR